MYKKLGMKIKIMAAAVVRFYTTVGLFTRTSCKLPLRTRMELHDTTPAFVKFYERTSGKPDEEKLKRFWSELHPTNPAFYDLRLSKWKAEGKSVEKMLLEEFAAFADYQSDFVHLQTIVPGQLERALTSFQTHFPDFHTNFGVHLLHSFKEMNGGMRKLEGKPTFIFGLDMIARFHTWQDNTPFFHHELTHVYLKQRHRPTSREWYGADTLLLNLWEEGLATYVSHLLNPQASYAELMLDFPTGLPEQTWPLRAFIAEDLLTNLRSTEDAVYRRYFVPWSGDGVVPERAGYFIGFVVLSELAKQYPLADLLNPSGEAELLELIEAQLVVLAELPEDRYLPPS